MRRHTAILLLATTLGFPISAPAQTYVDHATQAVSAGMIRSHVEFLADDALEGRAPSTRGGDLAAKYIIAQFTRLGLEPAGDSGTYFHRVPLVRFTPTASLQLGGEVFKQGDDFVLEPKRWEPSVGLEGPVVFVGYGIVAPEYGWNDYAGADVKGKIVAVLVNDPGLRDSTIFHGRAFTYYGRWTYKYEEAARQGAAGVLLIHTDESATYPWGTVRGSLAGTLVRLETPPTSLKAVGWIQRDAAARAFAAAGQDLKALMDRAWKRGFTAVPIDAPVKATLAQQITRTSTSNLLGRLPGEGPLAKEAVLVGAHYDHLGIGPAVEGDSIYNGARDDAAGVAEVLSIAEALVRGGVKTKRSIVFAAFAAEEAGLVGSNALVERPFMPLRDLAAVINLDGANLFGRTRDVSALGADQSSLGGALEAAARAERLRVSENPQESERGAIYRSDHFPFMRAGVPALSFEPGTEFVGRSDDWYRKTLAEWTATRYHRPQDEPGPWYVYDGAVQETRVALRVAQLAADASAQPTWNLDSEFRSAGENRVKSRQ
ncbi:MAG TPA: M20/M25/M40 family metallo-hydrolase [Gemmatimonadales bacterium]|nr:M20/M25/M40 family metallo-hydrolase [Gemmatimonadales bacterium]